MRRTALAVAMLLATAPVARAEEPATALKPNLQVVEVAAPTIRQDVVQPAIARTDDKAATKTTAQLGMGRSFWVLVAAIGAAALVILALA